MVDSILEWASLISAIVGCMVTLLLIVLIDLEYETEGDEDE